ncbi:MAG TPA: SH3 domain-containing protein [Leptolyngbyaceae cyanobacterium M65_K2018_010]|nr:SH3 domain-containing protein [Leptolyngbyaceae cyanobacterium M65_K2018_010]
MNLASGCCLFLTSMALLMATPVQGVSVPPPAALARPGANPILLAQEPINETVLFFETETMAVRIFRRGGALFMNLYNKTLNRVEVRASPAELVPSSRDRTVYKNSMGAAERLASVTVTYETELEIKAVNGAVVLKEAGFNPVVGVPNGPSTFKGNNFAPGTPAIVLSAQAARLRAQPRLGSEILASAPRREIVEVVDRVGNPADGFIWYQVLYQGTTGWVRGDLLQPA